MFTKIVMYEYIINLLTNINTDEIGHPDMNSFICYLRKKLAKLLFKKEQIRITMEYDVVLDYDY